MTEIQNTDETYMREALKQAKKALALGEVPIGCVIVHEGKSSPGVTTAVIQTRAPFPTRRSRPSERQEKS